MAGSVFVRPRAREDIIEQTLYIAEDNPDAADRFLDAVERAFEILADMPEMGNLRQFRHDRLLGIRMWPIHGFERHLVFYRPVDDGIEVIRVLYGAQDIAAILEDET